MIRFLILSAFIACPVSAQVPERAEEELNEAQSRLRAMLKRLQDAPRGALPGFVPPAAPDPERQLQMQLEQQVEVNRRLREMFEKNKEMTDEQRQAFERAMKIREDNLKARIAARPVAMPERPSAADAAFAGMPNLRTLGLLPMKQARQEEPGMVVRSATPRGPAAEAGLKAGDIILEIDGGKVPESVFAFEKMLNGRKDGIPFEAKVIRDGKPATVADIRFPASRAAPEKGELALSGINEFQYEATRYSEVRGVFKGQYVVTSRGIRVVSGAYSLFAVTAAGRIGVDAVRTKDGVKVECVTLQRFGRATTYTGTDDLPKDVAAAVDDLLASVR